MGIEEDVIVNDHEGCSVVPVDKIHRLLLDAFEKHIIVCRFWIWLEWPFLGNNGSIFWNVMYDVKFSLVIPLNLVKKILRILLKEENVSVDPL